MPVSKTKTLNHFKILSVVLMVLIMILILFLWNILQKQSSNSAQLYFTQTASEASFIPEGNGSNVYFLQLSQVDKKVGFISDAPKREFGTIDTSNFANLWTKQFAKDHPNASLIAYDNQNLPLTINLEIINASYDSRSSMMTYTTRLLSNGDFPQKLTDISLFIDSISINLINQSSDAGAGILIFQKNPTSSSEVPQGW
jgi:hypothetical protein